MSSHVAMKSGDVPRYNANERVTHWIVAITFLLLAASGLAFFHPAFWFLTSLLGGGVWARILHPFIGVVMFVFFALMAMRYWKDNVIQSYDREWNKRLSDVINNRDHNLPNDPKISPWVSLWKGIAKPLLALGAGIAVLGAFFHYITRGPKEVDDAKHGG